ncbi:MAG: cob(I)yrinic acid a,c-diamide adenosyltransferase [Verrucomicrobiales bacterium]
MSIVTGRGDGGETDLMYGRRVPKTHPRVVACGELDELNAALGLARTLSAHENIIAAIVARQTELVTVMGEVATDPADLARYEKSGFLRVTATSVAILTGETAALEQELNARFKDWATPGADTTPCGAAIDLARAICRRAERAVITVASENGEMVRYLNRLSDFLWLLARREARAALR